MAVALPDHRELSPRLFGLLDYHLTTAAAAHAHNHHRAQNHPPEHPRSSSSSSLSFSIAYDEACDLAAEFSRECADLDAHLLHLHQNLSKLLISWISRSITAKNAIYKLNLTIPPKATMASQCGISAVKMQKMLIQDFRLLTMELRRIEYIRSYANATLQLEALVGDLEDAVFSVMNQQNSKDLGPRQEKFFEAVRSMNHIEEYLVSPVKFRLQWCNLMNSVDSRIDRTLNLLRPHLLADHRALLSSLGWPPTVFTSKLESGKISILPNPLVLMQIDKQKAYSESFLALCALQHQQTRRDDRKLGLLGQQRQLTVGLWAIDELVSPVASRMEYHFSKWGDQPEFIFALVYKITRDFIVGVDDVLQPLIDRAKLVSFSAKEAWVSAMVQTLAGFLAKRVFSVFAERYNAKKTSLEAVASWLHLVDLMVKFDKQMMSLSSSEIHLFMEDYERLEGYSKGLSVFSLFTGRPDWLKVWAKIELKDAKMKLKAELKHERAWLVGIKQGDKSDVDNTTEKFLLYTREDYKAPSIVESALKLIWEMIERCKTLPGLLARIQFIRATATQVLWYLYKLLLLRYKRAQFLATDCNNKSLVTLCGVINAARYCEYKLQEWSDDIYFLEMRIAENNKNRFIEHDGDDDCYFFGEEIKSLADLEMDLLMEIITGLLHQFQVLTEEYVQNMELFEVEQEDVSVFKVLEGMDFSVTVDFVEALDTLRSQLCSVKLCLNPKDFSDLWRSIADGLDCFLFRSIFMCGYRFSAKGTNQLGADMHALFFVFQPFCARPEAFFPLIRESVKLLKMGTQALGRFQVVSSTNALDREEFLRFCGITHLSFDQAENILSSRKVGMASTEVRNKIGG